MNIKKIKIGKRYKIKYPGERGPFGISPPYEGIGVCVADVGYRLFEFNKLNPKIEGNSTVLFADIDIVREVKKRKKKKSVLQR